MQNPSTCQIYLDISQNLKIYYFAPAGVTLDQTYVMEGGETASTVINMPCPTPSYEVTGAECMLIPDDEGSDEDPSIIILESPHTQKSSESTTASQSDMAAAPVSADTEPCPTPGTECVQNDGVSSNQVVESLEKTYSQEQMRQKLRDLSKTHLQNNPTVVTYATVIVFVMDYPRTEVVNALIEKHELSNIDDEKGTIESAVNKIINNYKNKTKRSSKSKIGGFSLNFPNIHRANDAVKFLQFANENIKVSCAKTKKYGMKRQTTTTEAESTPAKRPPSDEVIDPVTTSTLPVLRKQCDMCFALRTEISELQKTLKETKRKLIKEGIEKDKALREERKKLRKEYGIKRQNQVRLYFIYPYSYYRSR